MIFSRITLTLCLAFYLVFTPRAISQERSYKLDIDFSADTPNKEWIAEITGSEYTDSSEIINALLVLRDKYYREGYLAAGFDILEIKNSIYKAYFNSGAQYLWGKLSIPEQYPPGINRIPRSILKKSEKALSISGSENIRSDLLRIFENNGYPFASARYDSINIIDSIVEATIFVEPGPFIIIDSLVSRSESFVSQKVLEQIIGLKIGQAYSEKDIIRAVRQIENSEIISMSRPLEVGFMEDKAWVYLSPKKKMANSFDGLIGLVPGGIDGNGLSLTGSLDLQLSNLIKQAETFSIRWKAPGKQNQQLKAVFDLPYFLGWPIGFTSSLDLYKKDTSYLSTEWTIGIMAAMGTQNRIGFYVRQKSSNVLLKTPNPLLSDMGVKLYGLNWRLEQLVNPLNPRKGIKMSADLGLGNKRLGPADQDGETDVYWEGDSEVDLYIPLGKLWVVNLGGRGGYLKGGQVYDNERFKIGGIYSLRGFDEESILADKYVLGTFEIRYLFSRNSNFHLFADGGGWWSEALDDNRSGRPIGFGAGVSLETRAGIILLDYALGFSNDIPLNIRNGKIHLGIKSLF